MESEQGIFDERKDINQEGEEKAEKIRREEECKMNVETKRVEEKSGRTRKHKTSRDQEEIQKGVRGQKARGAVRYEEATEDSRNPQAGRGMGSNLSVNQTEMEGNRKTEKGRKKEGER